MITRTFKLCLNAGTGSAPFINVSQTDKDEVWLFELYTETGERYIPSSGAIIGIKSDGHGIANTGTVDSEGRVVITETEQMTATAGRSIFELSIDGLTHGTANFIVNVEKKPIDGAIMSDSDLSLISEAIDSAAVIVDVIGGGDPSEVIGEHVDAWLDNHPEATTTVEDGAITAPKINSTLWDKLLVSEEASGAVASFDDGADDVPVKSLKVSLEPIQTGSGDPSPSNVRPITGHTEMNLVRTGKNLIDDGIVFKSTNTIIAIGNNYDFSIFLKAGTYTLSVEFLNDTHYGAFCRELNDSATTTIWPSTVTTNSASFTLSEDGWYRMWLYRGSPVVDVNDIGRFQLELGTTATSYEPYQGETFTIDLDSTVYGGSVDLATGVLTVDRVYKTLKWSAFGSKTAIGNYTRGLSNLATAERAVYPPAEGKPQLCDKAPYKAAYNEESNHFYVNATTINMFMPTDTDGDTDISVCYELATPQTIQLTPTEVKTLLGYNNISSTGTVDVIYHADTKLYVDKLTAVDNNIIAPTEADFVATRNYTTNDLVIVNDTLYKCTANIANGGTITPNSNVTQTTLGALIKALS